MSKKNMTHVVIFRDIIKISTVMSLLALIISFFLMSGFVEILVGLVLGNLVAMFKLFFTFYSISVSTDPNMQRKKSGIIIANIFGYVLLVILFFICAVYSTNALIFSILGVFIVYFSIVIHIIFEAFGIKKDRAND